MIYIEQSDNMLIDDYFTHQLNFENKYGKKSIVLMQVGSFYEFYGVNNDFEKIGDAQTIAELLNIQLSRKNKSILENSRTNSLMAGFPLNSIKRFINILLLNNYTVILVEQVSEPPNSRREITQIYSPGTYIEDINKSDPNNIVSLYITEESCIKTSKSLYSFGLSSIDLSTGHNIVYENSITYYEKNAFLEEIYRFIESYNPKEIIIHYNNINKIKIEDVKNKINSNQRLVYYKNDIEQKFTNINYQNSFLKKIFSETGIFTPIEYIDLERKPYALISYILLLQFSYEHNEKIIDKIRKPSFWEYNNHLILYNNAIYQLNIISLSGKSLIDIIQKTSTNMGKRLLKYRIMNPITDVVELNKRYDLIDILMKSNLTTHVSKILNEIIDIERLHRKISLQMLHPYEFLNLTYSYENIIKLFELFDVNNLSNQLLDINIDSINHFKNFIKEYENIFDMKEIGKYGLLKMGNSFFKKGNYLEIDEIQSEINNINNFYETECKFLSNLIEIGSDFVKLENNDKEGYFFQLTKKRSDILISKLEKEKEHLKYEVRKHTGSNVKLYSKELNNYNDRLDLLENKIKIMIKEEYLKLLNYFDSKYNDTLLNISNAIAIIDVIKCSVICANMYKYNRPTIIDENNGKSYFNASEIRHPIIEIINEESNYVKNDLSLFHNKCNGILLYGVNGSGKSSLSKAVGCNIIMAQMGFYVPSLTFQYYPYKKIFTRINGDDNIFKGMSSFAIEMDELRSILKYSDDRSIVLGDEICKGTEETSALSIVSASIMRFCEKNVNFIMATHFHKLYDLECINMIHNIKFMHLSIDYDIDNETIIYGRKLEEGPGSNLYGIEIAKFIIDDDCFINIAKKIRNTILSKNNDLLPDKKSNYNNKLYIDKCMVCGDNGLIYPLDTHHIIEQYTFNQNDFNKDKLSNLIILCKKHHDSVHNGNLEINGFIDTCDGKKLNYNIHDNILKTSNKKKYNNEQIDIIKKMADDLKYNKQFTKVIISELKKINISISLKTINKIICGEY